MYSLVYIATLALSADVSIAKETNAVANAIKAVHGNPVLVHVWATWCDACVHEFPHFAKLAKTPGLKVISVSVDLPQGIDSHVRPFLDQQHATFATLLIDVDDPTAVMHTLNPRWSGAIPADFLYDKDGKLVQHFFGASGKQIDEAISALVREK